MSAGLSRLSAGLSRLSAGLSRLSAGLSRLSGLLSVRLTPDLGGRGPRWKDVDHGQALSGGVPTRRDRGRATG
ncbi:hypothetical protein [Curtobacterium sp. DN_7.5]|uniref:hypothetical protein n=1 Tax=Curtobacterium sp. DN_7.5 TaxID=3049047 RepID=UPI003314225F